MHQRYLNINNCSGAYVWAFTGFWLVLAVLIMPAYFRDFGTLDTLERWAIAGIVFSGLALLVPWSLSHSISRISFDRLNRQVSIKRIYPGRRDVENHRWQEIVELKIEQTRDSEGDPYFKLNLILARNCVQTLAQSHQRDWLEAKRVEIQRFLDS